MGRLFKRGGIYYADLRAEGRGRPSLRTGDRQVAKERLRQKELEATNPAAHGRETLEDALTHLLDIAMASSPAGTVDSYTCRARHLERLLGRDTLLRDLRRDELLAYVAHRIHEEEASPHSVHKEMVVLRRALREAQRRELWSGQLDQLMPRVDPQYRPRDRWLTEGEYRDLLRALPPRRRIWLVVAVYTGACAGELERLEWGHVDLERGWVRIPGTKRTSRWRRVPLSTALRPWLESVPEEQRIGRLLAPWKNYRRDLRAACQRVGAAERKALVQAGATPVEADRLAPPVAPVSANDLRRTFASWLLQAGVDPLTVSRLLGHSSTRMVERVYGQLSEEIYRSAIDRLADCAEGVPHTVPPEALGGTDGTDDLEVTIENSVPRAGIEPATRGFSVRALVAIKGGKS